MIIATATIVVLRGAIESTYTRQLTMADLQQLLEIIPQGTAAIIQFFK